VAKTVTSIRLDDAEVQRADNLITYFEALPYAEAIAGRSGISRALVLRVAVQKGLDVLEGEARKGEAQTAAPHTEPLPPEPSPEDREAFRQRVEDAKEAGYTWRNDAWYTPSGSGPFPRLDDAEEDHASEQGAVP